MYGLDIGWYDNGQKESEINFKGGVEISAKYWSSNGEKVDSFEEAEEEIDSATHRM